MLEDMHDRTSLFVSEEMTTAIKQYAFYEEVLAYGGDRTNMKLKGVLVGVSEEIIDQLQKKDLEELEHKLDEVFREIVIDYKELMTRTDGLLTETETSIISEFEHFKKENEKLKLKREDRMKEFK